jgi:hypothetical protein
LHEDERNVLAIHLLTKEMDPRPEPAGAEVLKTDAADSIIR